MLYLNYNLYSLQFQLIYGNMSYIPIFKVCFYNIITMYVRILYAFAFYITKVSMMILIKRLKNVKTISIVQ